VRTPGLPGRPAGRWAAASLAGTLLLAGASLAGAEVAQRGNLRVHVAGSVSPQALPRTGSAPVAATLEVGIATTDASAPPQLQNVRIAINRHSHLDYTGLPACRLREIQPATTAAALAACRAAKVGAGSFRANVALPEQSPFPSRGKVLAFNGTLGARHVIFVHVYGTRPFPTSYTLSFAIHRSGGEFPTVLTAELPQSTGNWGFVTGMAVTLRRSFSYRGRRRSYLSAGCPAPKGFSRVAFPLAETSFSFADGRTLQTPIERSCRVKG